MKKSKFLKKVIVRNLYAPDINNGFIETLEALSVVDLDPEKDDLGEIYRRRLRAGIKTYIALVGEDVIGTTSLFIEPKFLHKGGFVGHIEDVSVHPDYQGKGVGSLMMAHAEKEAKKASCYKIILDCSNENKKFYKSIGYRKYENCMRKDLI